MKSICFALALVTLLATPFSMARNTFHMYAIKHALQSDKAKDKLDPRVPLYFGQQQVPPIQKRLVEVTVSRKTNAIGKTDYEACNDVLLTTLAKLQEKATVQGGNAVINIRSFYNERVVSSTSEYECHAGHVIAGVVLKGDIVILEGLPTPSHRDNEK